MTDTQASTQRAQPPELVLTIEQAALHLNCSVNTVRRRIKAGELSADKVPGRYRPEWRVMLNPLSTASTSQSSTHLEHSESVTQIGTHVVALREEIAALRAEVAQLHALLTSQVPRIEAPTVEPSSSNSEIEPRRPWWQFWR